MGIGLGALLDGIAHAGFLVILLVGLVLVAGRRVGPAVALGLVLAGWGVFHVLDQLVFHLALGAHHIREDAANPEVYDWGLFGIGIALLLAGGALDRRAASVARAG